MFNLDFQTRTVHQKLHLIKKDFKDFSEGTRNINWESEREGCESGVITSGTKVEYQ